MTISTTSGPVVGRSEGGVRSFLGIPYGAAPVGELRFRPPVPAPPRQTPIEATAFGPAAPQLPSMLDSFMSTADVPRSEDCLTLNVWSPEAAHDLPVLVWIHGGGFTTGTANTPWYDATALAKAGLVVVSVNYRLGALGFTHLAPRFGPAYAGSGNAGLLDCALALQWVQANAAAFGGDSSAVTVFGESAGGAMVVSLLALPAARGLFRRCIAQSASFTQLRGLDRADEVAGELLASLGVRDGDAAGLAAVGVDEVLKAQASVFESSDEFTAFAPTPDGDTLPVGVLEALASGSGDELELLIGCTRDEMNLFAAFDPSYAALDDESLRERASVYLGDRVDEAIARYRTARPGWNAGQLGAAIATDHGFRGPALRYAGERARRGAATWTYLFRWPTPVFGGILGACHGLELPFVFGNLDAPGVSMFTGDGAQRGALAADVQGAWIRFVKSGDPGWPRYEASTRPTMVFDLPSAVEDDPERELRELWER
jgi:para-nitrobenzyl esterase